MRCLCLFALPFQECAVLLVQEERLWIASNGGIFQATRLVDGSRGDWLVLFGERCNGRRQSINCTLLQRLSMFAQADQLLLGVGNNRLPGGSFTLPHQ